MFNNVFERFPGLRVAYLEGGAAWILLAAERFSKESKTRERLKNGELGLDFYGLRAKLQELGVVWVDKDE